MEDLKIRQKIKDMIKYGNQALMQFPKSERYALVVDIKKAMYSMLRLCVAANKHYFKKTTLQDLDIELAVLRDFLQFASEPDVKYLPLKKYEVWAGMLDEIGRMLGSWIKATQK